MVTPNSLPSDFPGELGQLLNRFGQTHLLLGWEKLPAAQKHALVEQTRELDFPLLASLFENKDKAAAAVDLSGLSPPLAFDPAADAAEAARATKRGEEALAKGEIACVLVAGGQGSRLGATIPKGCMPVGPISGKSLFQYHCERLRSVSRRYRVEIPLLVMTSPATHEATLEFFEQNRRFGMAPDQLHFFQQSTMPALDLATGKVLLEAPGRIFRAPDGHGGCLAALAGQGWLGWMKKRKISQIFYFQVDNPLVKMADPMFLGHHLLHDAEVSAKAVEKTNPQEKVGVFGQVPGADGTQRCTLVEYSDLPAEAAQARAAEDRLLFRCGSPAIHFFSRAFLEEVAPGHARLPFHLARKKVPHVNEQGQSVAPEKENALKFEKFVFDAIPLAKRWTLVMARREEDFAPLKNATGADSPETVRAGLMGRDRSWLTQAFPGDAAFAKAIEPLEVELSPLAATSSADLAERKLWPDGATLLGKAKDGALLCSDSSEQVS